MPTLKHSNVRSRKLRGGLLLLVLTLSFAGSADTNARSDGQGLEAGQPKCDSADLKLTEEQQLSLKEIVSRAGGQIVLFVGRAGIEKRVAASTIAAEKGVEVYRIDSARVVSKYIGETEKNLAEILNRAEELGAVLLFDEADALFGKRTGVKDANDRYANVEVGYLLQRMESYPGIILLATSLASSVNPAVERRAKQIVEFSTSQESAPDCRRS